MRLVNRDVRAQFPKAAFADAANQHQMFDAPETPVPLTVFDDARGEALADARKSG